MARLTGSYQKKANDAVALLEQAVSDAAKQARKLPEAKNTARKGGAEQVRFSIKQVNGKRVVWITDSGLSNKQLSNHAFVAEYIAKHVGEVYTIIESGQSVYIGKKLPKEYTQSKYTQSLKKWNPGALKAKNKAAGDLGLLIETATNRRWEKTKHPHSKDAKYGMYRYDSSFAFPVKNTDKLRVYDAELLIRNASDGKKYLYDVVNIKENTADVINLQQREIRFAGYEKTASHGGVSEDNLTQPKENVKKKFSLKESAGETDGALEAILQKVQNGNKVQGKEEVLRGVLLDAYNGKRTIDSIVKTFAGKGYRISTQTAKDIQALYREGRFSLKGADDYQGLVEQYGAFGPGEKPRVRDVQVPRQTSEDKKVSRTVRTVMEAAATPDAMVPTILLTALLRKKQPSSRP